jgi:arginine repressor
MKIQRVISRYYLIINKIRSSHYASFEEIREHLAEHDIDISLRTLQRDIQNIRDEFGIDVVYSKHKNGYYLDNQEDSDFVYFMKFFEMSVMSGTLTDSFRTTKNIVISLNLIL